MSKNSNFKIGLYIRVSTEEQAENPEGSIKSQEQRLREAVNYKNRLFGFGEIVEVYIDAGISAKNMKRPKLQEMLLDVKMKRIDLIMMTELSRLSRSMSDFIKIWEILEKNHCRFMSLREDFDTTTSAGEMLLLSIMNFNQFERKQTSERVKANLIARSKRGLYNGGAVPLGYKLTEQAGYLEIDQETSITIKKAFNKFLEIGSIALIAKWLNEKGYKTNLSREGGGSNMRVGHFTVDNLHRILINKMYISIKTFTAKGEVNECKAVWPAIIEEKTFKEVNELLKKNKSKYKPIKENKHPFLLSSVVFCKSCGDALIGKTANGKTKKFAYYGHSWATKRDSCLSKKILDCHPRRISAPVIEKMIWDEFQKFLKDEAFLKRLLDKVKDKFRNDDDLKERDRLRAKVYGINSQIEALAERIAFLPKGLSAASLFKHLEKLENNKKEVEQRLLEYKALDYEKRLVQLSTLKKFTEYVSFLIEENLSFEQNRRILQKFIKRIEIGPESVKAYWNMDREFYETELSVSGNLSLSYGKKEKEKKLGVRVRIA